jgi:hypothetical protein
MPIIGPLSRFPDFTSYCQSSAILQKDLEAPHFFRPRPRPRPRKTRPKDRACPQRPGFNRLDPRFRFLAFRFSSFLPLPTPLLPQFYHPNLIHSPTAIDHSLSFTPSKPTSRPPKPHPKLAQNLSTPFVTYFQPADTDLSRDCGILDPFPSHRSRPRLGFPLSAFSLSRFLRPVKGSFLERPSDSGWASGRKHKNEVSPDW